MSDNQDYETLAGGITTQNDDSNTVHGVAIGEGDTTKGGSGKLTEWTADALREGAKKFEGVPIVKDHPNVEKTSSGLRLTGQAPIDAKVGEVTRAKYKDGVGILWEGKVTDDEILGKIEEGIAEVSPVVQRDLEKLDDSKYRATEIKGVRDLGVVSKGAAESNSIDTGMAAMSAEALASAFDARESATPNGEDNKSDDPETASSVASDDETNEDTMTDENDLTEDEKAVLAASEDVSEPVEALNDIAAAEQPQIVEQDEYESLQEQVDTAKDLYAESLSERWETDKDKIKNNFGLEALREEFEDDDGELDTEALVQEPETGEPESEPEDGVEALSEDADMEKAEALYGDYEMMSNPPQGLEDDITEALGVDDFDTAVEVLD